MVSTFYTWYSITLGDYLSNICKWCGCKIENFKQDKEEVGMLTSYKFREVTFRRHDPQGKLKEHLQQVGFIWIYSLVDLLPRELSQQQVLVKSKIPTLDQIPQIDKEA